MAENMILHSESFERAAYRLASEVDTINRAASTMMEAAQIYERSVGKLVQAMGMVAENDVRKSLGQSMAYDESAFINL